MLNDPPLPDVVEVSIFGPGKGECVVVHIGNGEWIVVDSCIDRRTKQIPALEYLWKMDVDVETDVKLVVATHAHDDHFAGIAEIFDACATARFVCSDAATLEEILAHAKLPDIAGIPRRCSAYNEYRRIIEIVQKRGDSLPGLHPIKYADELRDLYTRTNPIDATVVALSPSDAAKTRARAKLATAFPAVLGRRRLTSMDPNELSVALWVTVGDKSVLLGADLLIGPAGCGWQGVLAAVENSPRSDEFKNASVFKIPHHGSPNAHHEDIWRRMISDSPVALLAPYRAGRRPLPDAADRARICALTTQAYISAGPRLPAPQARVRKEAAKLTAVAKNVREPWGTLGHVRARSRIGEEGWAIERWPPAQQLCN